MNSFIASSVKSPFFKRLNPGSIPVLLVAVLFVGLIGCDKAKELADNAVAKVKKDFKSAKDKITNAANDDGTKTDQQNANTTPGKRLGKDSLNNSSSTTNSSKSTDSGGMTLDAFKRIPTNQIQDHHLEALAADANVVDKVDELNLYMSAVTRKGLETLGKFPNLTVLKAQQVRALPGNMDAIGKLKSLKELELVGNPLTDEDFAQIVSLTKLEVINITGTQITDDGFRCFNQMPNLAVMVMDKMGHLQGKGFKYVNRNSIREIKANGSNIGYYAFQSLGGSESLETLWLNGARVTDNAMQGIGRCPNLTTLRLERNDLTNKGIGYLKNHQKLESLVLSGNTRLNNQALGHLTKCNSLKMVNVSGTTCSTDVVEEFHKYVPDCKIVF